MRPRLAPVVRLVARNMTAEHRPRPALDDAEILAAVARCDRGAAAALHARARPQIDATIARTLGRHDPDHDDLAQVAVIALVDSLKRFRGECSLDTWIVRITVRAVLKEMRRRKSLRHTFDFSTSVDSIERSSSSSDVERAAMLKVAVERVRGHLDAMDPDKAWTVVLHDVCGHDLREIAEMTEVSVAAAQSRLVRGRAELHGRVAADPELAGVLEQWSGRQP